VDRRSGSHYCRQRRTGGPRPGRCLDDLIERWLVFERRQVNRGYAGFDDWQTEEIERSSPIVDVSVGEILEQAIGIEPARWTKSDQMRVGAYLKTNGWKRYNARIGSRADNIREWRYRR
jgi:putative DNA primase/helicase